MENFTWPGEFTSRNKRKKEEEKKKTCSNSYADSKQAVKAFLGADEDMMKLGTYDNLATWQKSWWNSETNLVTVFEQHQICERRKRGANRELALQGWLIWVGVVWVREREGRGGWGDAGGGGERPPLFKLYQNSTAAVVSPVHHKDVPPPFRVELLKDHRLE